jgi:hypothetical protein
MAAYHTIILQMIFNKDLEWIANQHFSISAIRQNEPAGWNAERL